MSSNKDLFEKASELAKRHENELPCQRGHALTEDGKEYVIEGEGCPFDGWIPKQRFSEKLRKMVDFPYYRMCDKCVAASMFYRERNEEEMKPIIEATKAKMMENGY